MSKKTGGALVMVIVSGTGLATSFSNDGSTAHVESDFSHSYEFASHTLPGRLMRDLDDFYLL